MRRLMITVIAIVMSVVAVVALGLLVFMFTNTGDALNAYLHRARHQRSMFRKAKTLATKLGKQLVVIGDPKTPHTMTAIFPTYQCGDVCIDIAGCHCNSRKTTIMQEDVLVALKKLPTDSAVIYESEVLDYVDDIAGVVEEMQRVSGGRMFATHFTSVRSRILTKSFRDKWATKRLVVQYPPHAPYAFLEKPGTASWQAHM